MRSTISFIFLTVTNLLAQNSPINFLGRPVEINPLILDITMAQDISGADKIYTCTYSRGNRSQGCYFVEVDPMSGETVNKLHIPDRIGPYHIVTGSDGKIYLGIYGNGLSELWSYDPENQKIRNLGTTIKGEDFTFGLAATPSKKIYGGTHGNGKIFEFNTVDKTFRDLGTLVAGNKYPKAFLPYKTDQLLIGSGSPAHLSLFEPQSGAKTNISLPDKYHKISFVYNLWESNSYIFARLAPEGTVLILDKTNLNFISELPESDFSAIVPASSNTIYYRSINDYIYEYNITSEQIINRWQIPHWMRSVKIFPQLINRSLWLTGINEDGRWWRWQPETGEYVSRYLEIPLIGTNITVMCPGPENTIFGGTYETNALFSYTPSTGKIINYGNISPGRTGEILGIVYAQGKLFTASYIQAVLCVYDPKKPWMPGNSKNSNPREIGEIGAEQNRPMDMLEGPDGKIYIASRAQYGKYQGALSLYDPASDSIKVIRETEGHQNIISLASDSKRRVFFGSSRLIEGKESVPGSATIRIYDCIKQNVSNKLVPKSDGFSIEKMVFKDPYLVGLVDQEIFLYNFTQNNLKLTGKTGFIGLFTAENQEILVYNSASIYSYDPVRNKLEKIFSHGSNAHQGVVKLMDGNIYIARNDSLFTSNILKTHSF